MAIELDNLVLAQLREIRTQLQGLDKLDALEKKFDGLDRKFDDLRGYVAHALGFASMSHLKNEQQDARLDTDAAERGRLTEQVATLDRRVTKLEERLET